MEKQLLEELQSKSQRLMVEQALIIEQGYGFYSLEAHEYLQTQCHYGGVSHSRPIILPMSKNDWYPKNEWKLFENFYAKSNKLWPRDTHSFYSLDSLVSKAPGFLYFGYAVCDDGLWPCAFFVQFMMTLEIKGVPGELFSEEYVIDPMALANGKKPDCYIGVLVPPSFVEEWLLAGHKFKHPLEKCANQEIMEKLEDSNWRKEILLGQQEMLSNVSEDFQDRVCKWLLKE